MDWMVNPPVPDGTLDEAADRQQTAGSYPGILAGAPAASGGTQASHFGTGLPQTRGRTRRRRVDQQAFWSSDSLGDGIGIGSSNGKLQLTAATASKLGGVLQTSAVTDLTDSSGGTSDGTLAAISGSGDDANINNNFADLADKVNTLMAAMRTSGQLGT